MATQRFVSFHPNPWGNDPISRAYFSNGLKPPTSSIFSGVRLKGKTDRPWMHGKFTINVSMAIVFSANLEIPDLRLWGFMPVITRLPTTIRTLSGGHEVSFWKWWVLLRDQSQFLWENRTTCYPTRPISHQDLAQKMEMEHGRMGDSLAKLQENGTRPVMPMPIPPACNDHQGQEWRQAIPCARSLTKMRMENMKP